MYEHISSPNQSSRKNHEISGLIAHFTAGGEINGTVRYMCNKIINKKTGESYNARASCHYITGREGKTVMLVPENKSAWHSGSRTTSPVLNGKKNLNLWTIGHEICNWGALRKHGDKFYCWPNNWTKLYTGPTPANIPLRSDVTDSYLLKDGSPAFPDGTIEYWEPYTVEQFNATVTLWTEIVERYQIRKEWIAGHDQVDSTRKIDPGPAFPWGEILDQIYAIKGRSSILNIKDEEEEEAIAERNYENARDKAKSMFNIFF